MSLFGGVPGEDEKKGRKDVSIISVEEDPIDRSLDVPEEYQEKCAKIIEKHYGEGGEIVTEDPSTMEGIYRNLDPEGQGKLDELRKEFE
ncbi:MAG: hypothetical protein ACLFTQ_00180 [Candidatus Aenigmatarchaeota archaeon]